MRNEPGAGAARILVALLSAALAATAVPAGAQNSPSPAPASSRPDPLFEAARRAFEAYPEAERKAIQDDLVWASDFRGGTSGAFGALTFRAITGLQKQAGLPADGILTQAMRAAIGKEAARARAALGFTATVDRKTGIRIGVPQKLLDRSLPGRSGTRWTNADGSPTLEAIVSTDPLAVLFDRFTTATPGRRVTYKVSRPDWFVVTFDAGPQRSYVRFAATPEGAKGFAFTYPVAGGAELDRLSVAIANSFDPSPAAPAGVAAGPGAAPGTAPAGATPPAATAREAAGAFATALVVAPGLLLTTASVSSCAGPVVAGSPARLARIDPAAGLALLESSGRTSRAPPAAAALPADAAPLLVVGFGASAGPPALTLAAGEARVAAGSTDLRVFAPLQRGAAGSPVLDREGALVGLVSGARPEPRLVAGIVPQASWPVVGEGAVQAFLAAAGVKLPSAPTSAGRAMTAGEVAGLVRDAVLPVTCGP